MTESENRTKAEVKVTRVYVGNLFETVEKAALLEAEFTKYGTVNQIWLARNPRGFAFVDFVNEEDAINACTELNGTNSEVLGSKLIVEINTPGPPSDEEEDDDFLEDLESKIKELDGQKR